MKYVLLFKNKLTPEKVVVHDSHDQLDNILADNIKYITSNNLDLSFWSVADDKLPDIRFENDSSSNYNFNVFLGLLNHGNLLSDNIAIMDRLSKLNTQVSLFFVMDYMGLKSHHLTIHQAESLVNGEYERFSIIPMSRYNKKEIDKQLILLNDKHDFSLKKSKNMDNLKLSDSDIKDVFLEVFKEKDYSKNDLKYAVLSNDPEITALSIRFFDNKDQMLSFVNDHIDINSDQRFLNFKYSTYLLPEHIESVIKQDYDLDRQEPDTFYKSIIADEGVLIANDKDLREYIEKHKEIILEYKDNDDNLIVEEDVSEETLEESTWPSYDPSDPDWMGAAEELKFEAKQLGYDLLPGDLQDLERLSKELVSIRAGKEIGKAFEETIEGMRNGEYDNVYKHTDRSNFTKTEELEFQAKELGYIIKPEDWHDINKLNDKLEVKRDELNNFVKDNKAKDRELIVKLRSQAEQLGYKLKPGDLDDLHWLSNKLTEINKNQSNDLNLKKKDSMETPITNQEKYATQLVGSAIKNDKGEDNNYFNCKINKENLLKCNVYSYHSNFQNKDIENFNLSLKVKKSPTGPVTHVIVDSIYHKSNIQDKFAEVNMRIEKEKILAAPANEKGELDLLVSLFDKNKEKTFSHDDYKVSLKQPAGEKIPDNAYIGTANKIDHSKYKTNAKDGRIERDFIGTAFIDHNDKLSHGQVLNVSMDKEKLMESTTDDKKSVFVNFIPVKNNPEQLAAYVSHNKNDQFAQFTFKLNVEKLNSLEKNQDGQIKVSGYFDDKIENKNYNIKVVEHLSKEDRINGKKPLEIGEGADKEHISKWQQSSSKDLKENVSSDLSKASKIIKKDKEEGSSIKLPSVESIKGISNEKDKGIER